MKHIKFASPKWAGYSGHFGRILFDNGISVDPVSRLDRDLLAAAEVFVEVDENGRERPAGVAHRLVVESKLRLPVEKPLKRQSEQDKAKEQLEVASRVDQAPTDFYTREELEAVADKEGIKGLRIIAEPWGVKHRAIPVLIEMILGAQSAFKDKRAKRLEVAAASAEEIIKASEQPVIKHSSKDDADTINDAAASGDLGAALNTQEGEGA